jgi:hypothetical protein
MVVGHLYVNVRIILVALVSFLSVTPVLAKSVQFEAELDRQEIAEDESVSLQITVQSDSEVQSEQPEFSAPDFETINEYTSSNMQSTYNNGSFQSIIQKQFTFVLRPKKQGRLKISGIRAKVDDQVMTAPEKEVSVTAGGGGTAPPANYGGAGSGLRGAGKANRGAAVFLRVETDKQKVFKGESLTVSYYFFARANGFTIAGEKYPTMSGFLKEEVDMPVLTGRLDTQVVTLDGIAYRKVLLARYSATPLKSGKLNIDPLYVKVQYYDQQSRGGGDDEVQDLFSQFFNRMTPQVAQLKSDPLTLEVEDTPKSPEDFSGAVGEFSAVSVIDKNEVKVNEPFTLTLKLEGRGSFSAVKAPALNLPKGLQLFESKNQTRGGKAGTQGEKIFEYLIVPRAPGSSTIPGFKFSYFNVRQGKYLPISTEGFSVNVTGTAEDLAGSGPSDPLLNGNEDKSETTSSKNEVSQTPSFSVLNALKPKAGRLSNGALVGIGIASFGLVIPLLGIFLRRKKSVLDPERKRKLALERRRIEFDRKWGNVKWEEMSSSQVREAAAAAVNTFLDWCALHCGDEVRSLAREDLKKCVVDQGKLTEEAWNQLVDVLDSLEMIQFSGQGTGSTEFRATAERSIGKLRQILT